MKKLDRHQIQTEFNSRKDNFRRQFNEYGLLDTLTGISEAIDDLQKEGFDVSLDIQLRGYYAAKRFLSAEGTLYLNEEAFPISIGSPEWSDRTHTIFNLPEENSITLCHDKVVNPEAAIDFQKCILNIMAKRALVKECDKAGVFKKPEDDIRPVVSLDQLKKPGMQ